MRIFLKNNEWRGLRGLGSNGKDSTFRSMKSAENLFEKKAGKQSSETQALSPGTLCFG